MTTFPDLKVLMDGLSDQGIRLFIADTRRHGHRAGSSSVSLSQAATNSCSPPPFQVQPRLLAEAVYRAQACAMAR
jgi:hypothetical protein